MKGTVYGALEQTDTRDELGKRVAALEAVLLATPFALARTRSRDFLRERRSRATFGHSARAWSRTVRVLDFARDHGRERFARP